MWSEKDTRQLVLSLKHNNHVDLDDRANLYQIFRMFTQLDQLNITTEQVGWMQSFWRSIGQAGRGDLVAKWRTVTAHRTYTNAPSIERFFRKVGVFVKHPFFYI